MAAGIHAGEGGGVPVGGEKEGEEHGVAVAAAVGWSEDEGSGFVGDTWSGGGEKDDRGVE